jgi:hypothetical protein
MLPVHYDEVNNIHKSYNTFDHLNNHQLLLRNSAPLFKVPKSQAGANSRIMAAHRFDIQKRKDDYFYAIIVNSNTWTGPYCTWSALELNPSDYRTN